MSGIIGKKIGMTSMFNDQGKNIPCTIIQAGPCVVTQVKTIDNDGYKAVQLAFDDKSEKNVTAANLGHFKKAKSTPKAKLVEFFGFENPTNALLWLQNNNNNKNKIHQITRQRGMYWWNL